MAAHRFDCVPTSESRREMHITAHAKISWIDDLVGARVYIDKRYPKHLVCGNLTVQYRLSVDARLVSESLYTNVSHVSALDS